MSYRPLVAVVAYHLGDDRVARWPHGGYGVPGPYIECMRRAGARTAIVSPGEHGTPEELLEPFDGLLLVGGGDIDPARYGGKADDTHLYGVEPDRDELEIRLLLAADRMRLPTLCICRGMQAMNVAFGGTLHPHLPDVPGMLQHGVPVLDTQSLHDVEVEHASRLFATTKVSTLAASSHHHQGVDRVGDGLLVSGRTSDGLVEAIERDHDLDADLDRWMIGVQWHPEDAANGDPAQQALFDGIALLARVRGSKAEHHGVGRSPAYAIVEPDPAWPERFEEEAPRLRVALGAQVVRIEHIGSTSVPGLAAKPVIDISIGLVSVEPRGAYVPALVDLGYRTVLDPTDPDHEFASRDLDGERRFNVHLCRAGSPFERRHLAFRDWLRTHPRDAVAYGDLKRELAAEHPNDVHTYTEGKTGFIRAIEAKALAAASRAVPGVGERTSQFGPIPG
jgi:putative glutamine amidotransferase